MSKHRTIIKYILTVSLIIQSVIKTNAGELNLEDRLRQHVIKLSDAIGERNYWFYENLNKAAEYIQSEFKQYGLWVELQTYEIDGKKFSNIIATKKGRSSLERIIVVGAHYDSVAGSPGADDNASAVAGLLELARMFSNQQLSSTIKFIAFVNEEPPYFQTAQMGSFKYAQLSKRSKENIVAMICLEMIGYYRQDRRSQDYPLFLGLFYPDTANFIAFVSNLGSKFLLNRFSQLFKKHSNFPSESLAAPSIIAGIDWSDHSSFWKNGYKAMMVTDTSFYRYPYYHSPLDTYEKLDYKNMAQVVEGLYKTIGDL